MKDAHLFLFILEFLLTHTPFSVIIIVEMAKKKTQVVKMVHTWVKFLHKKSIELPIPGEHFPFISSLLN